MSAPATIGLRLEEPGDGAAIHEIHRLAFGRDAEADLVDAVRDADAGVLSMVAVEGAPGSAGQVLAHVLYTFVTVSTENGEQASLLGLGPVAVLPSRQDAGIGTMLIEASLERLRSEGYPGAVVLGNPRYYSRFGFLSAGVYGLRWEMDGPEEAFMAVELSPGALGGVGGVVRFRPEFTGV